MVVSAGKVADIERVGMLSGLGEFSIYIFGFQNLALVAALLHLSQVCTESERGSKSKGEREYASIGVHARE